MKHRTLILCFFVFGVVFFPKCDYISFREKLPQDFSFKIKDSSYEFDSKTRIYIRNYVNIDSSILITITNDEILSIYQAYINANFWSFPDTFRCSIFGSLTLPAFETTIECSYKGKSKSSTNTTYCSRKKQQAKSIRFDNLEQIMFEIIHNKTEVKKMRPSDRIYM